MPSNPVSRIEPARAVFPSFAQRMSALFAVLALVLAVLAWQVYRTVGSLIDASTWVAHTHQVKEAIVSAVSALRDAEAAQRAYAIGADPTRLADGMTATPKIAEHMATLLHLVEDNPEQHALAEQLDGLLAQRQQMMTEALATLREKGIEGLKANPTFKSARQQDMQVDELSMRMLRLEDGYLVERKLSSLATARATRVITLAAVLLSAMMLGLALLLILREQRRRMISERRLLESMDSLAGSLEESKRLGAALQQLSDLADMLQGCRTLDEAAQGLTVALPNLFPHMSGAVNLINPSQNLVVAFAVWGSASSIDVVYAPDDCWALRRGHAYPQPGNHATFRCKHFSDDDCTAIADQLCVPLLAQGAVLGTLVLRADAPIGSAARDLATAAAENISLAVSNLKLQDTLRTQSLRDPLTGLFNRRYLEISLARDLARAVRRSQPLAVLMLDIDHFKPFNDSHGHDAGDAVLGQVGQLIAGMVREEDAACRYGGEEFTIILQETDSASALDRAEEICASVRAMEIMHRRQNIGPVTLSIGVASYPQHGDTPEQLLRRADRALYVAKRSGRDRVCVADREGRIQERGVSDSPRMTIDAAGASTRRDHEQDPPRRLN